MKTNELKKAKREEVKQWVNEKIQFVMTEGDLKVEKNKNILENLLNIQEKLININGTKLTDQTKQWLKERIKFIKNNSGEDDFNALQALEYFRYIQSL